MKMTVLVPTTRNDGSPVSDEEQEGIVDLFWSAFGAASVEGNVSGYWVNNGTLYRDALVKIIVATDDDREAEFVAIVEEIGRQLGQLAMYVEIDRHTEVRIIDID